MNSGMSRSVACLALGLTLAGRLPAEVNVTTYHNDVARSGQNIRETRLTPANVNSTDFGRLFSVPLDGFTYAQPLYVSAVSLAGGTHNVLYVATEHDSVYAIDADVGTVYAQASLVATGGRSVIGTPDLNCGDLVPEIGISGTPVIDAAAGILYVVAKSKVNGGFVQQLHALSVATLKEALNGPVTIHATATGTGYDAVDGVINFNPKSQNQRAALLLDNGHVVIGWSSHCDDDPWHGWIMSYSAKTLAQEAVFNSSPNGNRGGVWMSGGGPASDGAGNIFFATGNGSWNGTSDFSDSVVKLGPPANGRFPILDYFTPYDQGMLASNDMDLGSGGALLLPTLASGGQLLAQQGKQGTMYLLDRTDLGKYCIKHSPPCSGGDPQIVQEIVGASPGIWGSPAYWNGFLYLTGANDSIKAYTFNAGNSGRISVTPSSKSAQVFAFPAPTPAISADGGNNGILWALDGSADDSQCDAGAHCLGLYAYDATNLAKLLYSSGQAANHRDSPGPPVKFQTPIIVNGKVYVAAQSAVSAYGLLADALPVAARPSLSPAPGSYLGTQGVTLRGTTPGAVIYYTINGTTPTAGSSRYSGPLQVSSTTTIRAIAAAEGYFTSSEVVGTYFLNLPASLNLSAMANVVATVDNGSGASNGGLDGVGYAYSAALLGTSIDWAGSTFILGAAGVPDAISDTVIELPAGKHPTLRLLGAGVDGNQPHQTFVVTYSDGTTTTITQSISDWWTPQHYAGESQVLNMPYKIVPSGGVQNGAVSLYGYSFPINGTKTLKSLTLPKNRHVVILALDL
jgi:hypothetical protein